MVQHANIATIANLLILFICGLVKHSEQACDTYGCQNGGTCTDPSSDVSCCFCPPGYGGTHCGIADDQAAQCAACSNGEQACLCTDGRTVLTKAKCKCFPKSASVLYLDVKTEKVIRKRMEEINIGDKVLSVDPTDQRVKYEYIYGFGHRVKDQVVDDYQNIKIGSGSEDEVDVTITASKGHFLWAMSDTNPASTGGFQLRPAGDIAPGDAVLVPSYDSDEDGDARVIMKAAAVNGTFTSRDTGVYSPHAVGGNLIVDGVVWSCYTDALPAHISHLLLWPARQGFHMMGNTVWFRYLDQHLITNIIDVGRGLIEMYSTD